MSKQISKIGFMIRDADHVVDGGYNFFNEKTVKRVWDIWSLNICKINIKII